MNPLMILCPLCGETLGGFIRSGRDRALAGPFCPVLEVVRWLILAPDWNRDLLAEAS